MIPEALVLMMVMFTNSGAHHASTRPIALHGYKCVSHSQLILCQVENILLCTTGKSLKKKYFTRMKEVSNKVVQEANTDLKSEMIIEKQGLI